MQMREANCRHSIIQQTDEDREQWKKEKGCAGFPDQGAVGQEVSRVGEQGGGVGDADGGRQEG